jgi:hypothetical protein
MNKNKKTPSTAPFESTRTLAEAVVDLLIEPGVESSLFQILSQLLTRKYTGFGSYMASTILHKKADYRKSPRIKNLTIRISSHKIFRICQLHN